MIDRLVRFNLTALWALAGVIVALAPSSRVAAAELSAADVDFFEKKVRPLLVEHCYKCHASDSKKIRGGLVLDTKAGWEKGGDTGPAITPGKPGDSLLITAVTYKDPFIEMPPKGKLPDKDVAVLIEWVKRGAPDPRVGNSGAPVQETIDLEKGRQFWSFQPPKQHAPPAVRDASWPRDDVDRFILAKLEANDLHPNPDADKRTLIRRAYFALVGLPPTPEEIDAFLRDESPDAFAKVIDRLLDSPRFGERWGRHWLDVARFAESSGGGRTLVFQNAWRYRDYVIDAFNKDKPYDRFVREQIAGDLLPYDSPQQRAEQLTGAGYLMLGAINYELQDKELLRMEVVDEQIDTLGRTFLGMTIGCARCHDHKFDPIPTADYYALAGIFRSTKSLLPGNVSGYVERELPVSAEKQAKLDAHAAKVNAAKEAIKQAKSQHDDLAKQFAKLTGEPVQTASAELAGDKSVPADELDGIVIDDADAKLDGGWTGSVSVARFVNAEYRYTSGGDKRATFETKLPQPGRYEVRVSHAAHANRASNTKITVHHRDGVTEKRVNQKQTPNIDGLFVSLGEFDFDAKATVVIHTAGANGTVIADAVQLLPDEALLAKADDEPVAQKDDAKPATAKEKEAAALARRKEQEKQRKIAALEPKVDAAAERVKQLEDDLKKLEKQAPPAPPKVMSVAVAPDAGDYHICVRGNVHNLGEEVPRGFLQVATPSSLTARPNIAKDEPGRRELAEWVAHPDNPLTARVMVNRIWHHLFDAGLVRTCDNFGATGEAPTHPQLLDHLAIQFVNDGWSVKRMIRRLMLTRTWQLSSSRHTSQARAAKQVDMENRLLAYFPRKRLEAEAIRDTMLFVSGRLDLASGGATMKPGTRSSFGYDFDSTRRSVYLPVFRNTLPDVFDAFDFANPNIVVGRRTASTLPTQALYLMNSPDVQAEAKHAAERLLRDTAEGESSSPAARITLAYERALGRPPSAAERDLALQHLAAFDDPRDAFASLFHGLFASVEFRFVE